MLFEGQLYLDYWVVVLISLSSFSQSFSPLSTLQPQLTSSTYLRRPPPPILHYPCDKAQTPGHGLQGPQDVDPLQCSLTISPLSPPPPSQPWCWKQHRTALGFPHLSCFLSAPDISTCYSSISLWDRLNKIIDVRCLFLHFEHSKCLNKGLTAERSNALYERKQGGRDLANTDPTSGK